MATEKRVTLIAGPTASGKSALALDRAALEPSVIINADAMQVYRELKVLTSRPDVADEARAPHRLYGHVPARTAYSVSLWLEDVGRALDDAWQEGRRAIVLGGTGLYFRALEFGLAHVPEVPPDIRRKWRNRLDAEGSEALHRVLARQDAGEAARLEPGDSQRIVRALEVLDATGKTLSSFQTGPHGVSMLQDATVERLVLMPDREVLYERCNDRFDNMMADGALDEVRALLALDLDTDLPAMKAIGVRALGRSLRGEVPLDEAIATATRETRNYAKRQMTWIRGQMADWPRAET